MRVLIVGGVAGGASCAARLRRLSEDAEIILFDRGPYVSFANCGLPYYVGDVIPDEEDLLVATPVFFKRRFNLDVRVENEVLKIDRVKSEIEIKELKTGRVYREPYDRLVLSPGAAPVKPPLPGIDLDGIFVLRTIPDARQIKIWIRDCQAQSAVVVGGGFIGLEMAENLVRLGIKVTVIEMLSQVMPNLDSEMAAFIEEHLREKSVALHMNDAVSGFEKLVDNRLNVRVKSGKNYETDLVVLSVGVKPETKLVLEAGLEIGSNGGIKVDDQMRTSDPKIWAVGDAALVRDFVTGEPVLVPLAGPANREGRIAADSIMKRKVRFRGVQASAVCKIFDLVAAATGASEKTLRKLNRPFEKVYLHPFSHAGYYPGAGTIHMKLIFSPGDGKVLGAQAIGRDGAEKRIDVIAMAIQKGATVYDLEEAELCYAPQFGAAKDPVNIAGMIAANALRGDAPLADWNELRQKKVFLLDVRTPEEFQKGHAEGAVNIPIDVIRTRLSAIPKDQEIWVYCGVGLRAHNATRILRNLGYQAKNISGGYQTYRKMNF